MEGYFSENVWEASVSIRNLPGPIGFPIVKSLKILNRNDLEFFVSTLKEGSEENIISSLAFAQEQCLLTFQYDT